MSERALRFWREVPRASTAYPERADERESRLDRVLLAGAAHLKRPFVRALTRAARVVEIVEREQPAIDALSEARLRQAADDLRGAFLKHGFTPELVARSFALVRTAAQRTIGLRHFPVQLMGGYVMLEGRLAEMETGEGKTLAATLPAATVALAGAPVHIVTVNDYLAKRDGEWMGPVYAALGLTVGIGQSGQQPTERRAVYQADVAYCTNKDLGFDYLRDTLAVQTRKGKGRLALETMLGHAESSERLLLRGLHFAIVDEADSVLIDEARTPLVIAGAEDAGSEAGLYGAALEIAQALDAQKDYTIEPRERLVTFTDHGRGRLKGLAESLPGAWGSARGREELVQQALNALHLFELDKHYLVRDGKVQIIDEYTGRIMPDRSWERGLQQLIEAKEQCDVTGRRATLARITYQRLFRRYLRLAGMTGTATEVAGELEAVYGLEVVRIPTNLPTKRSNAGIRLYASGARKWLAVAHTVAQLRARGRPVLIGTRSVSASEELGAVLRAEGLEHVVLNARQDSGEAEIVSRAGEAGRVTVATNMAGRGTDIQLGSGVAGRGGLHVILAEFHESKRIDRQLFGRGGRQGDAGSYEAIVSLEDEIFRKHAARMTGLVGARCAVTAHPLPAPCAKYLRMTAQMSAERVNSADRRRTLELDRQLDTALAFAGRSE